MPASRVVFLVDRVTDRGFVEETWAAAAPADSSGERPAGANLLFVADGPRAGDVGSQVVADDAYLRNSILNPSAQVVDGWQPIMPTFQGQLTEEELVALIAYLHTIGPGAGAPPPEPRPSPPPRPPLDPARPGSLSPLTGSPTP